VAATAAALNALEDWQPLAKRFGRNPFLLVGTLTTTDREMPSATGGMEPRLEPDIQLSVQNSARVACTRPRWCSIRSTPCTHRCGVMRGRVEEAALADE